MKNKIIVIALIAVLSSYFFWKNEKVQNKENPIPTVSQSEPIAKEEPVVYTNLQTYQSEELGISFQYPSTLGKAWENISGGNGELFALKFLDDKGIAADIDLGREYYYPTLRTCDDILLKGFNDGDRMPFDCETLTVDNHSVTILTYIERGRSNGYTSASKEAHFQTKKGVWSLSATDEDMYGDLISIVKTLKYLQ